MATRTPVTPGHRTYAPVRMGTVAGRIQHRAMPADHHAEEGAVAISNRAEALFGALNQVIEREVVPIATEVDQSERFPGHLLPLLHGLGLLAPDLPFGYGGPGHGLTITCMAREAIARVCANTAQLIGQNCVSLVAPLLDAGTEAQRRRWLARIAAKPLLGAVALARPGGARRPGELAMSWRGKVILLHGRVDAVAMAPVSHVLDVMTSARPGHAGDALPTACLVDVRTPGIRFTPRQRRIGIRAIPVCDVHFDAVEVAAEDGIFAQHGTGDLIDKVVARMRLTAAATALGVAGAALDITVGSVLSGRTSFVRSDPPASSTTSSRPPGAGWQA